VKWMVGGMMVVFALCGAGLVYAGLRELARKWQARGRWERTEGLVVRVERKTMRLSNQRPNVRPTVLNFPVVKFRTQAGREISHKMETGDTGQRSRYVAGQKLAIVYDPEEEFPPMIDSWSGVWLTSLMLVIGGAAFIGGAVLIYVAFGDRFVGS
jgi:hypothetical protein